MAERLVSFLSKLLFTLPNKALHHRFWEQASGCKYLSHGVRIGIVACSELFGMDASSYEQAINTESRRALEIGAHGVADGQHTMMLYGFAPRGLGETQGLLVDGPVRLAG